MQTFKLSASFFVDANGIVIPKAKKLTFAIKTKIFNRDHGKCKICLSDVSFFSGNTVSPFKKKTNAHVDHIFPRSKGGQYDETNLQLLCVSCNTSKGAK
jgi:5-methylcytosine-specific restriction endonuclease McrA